MSDKFSDSTQILKWVATSIKNEDIHNFKIEVVGSSEKGEGYATDVLFVKVIGNKKTNGKSTELNLVLKIGKHFGAFDSKQIEDAYLKEIFLYDRVFLEYKKFEEFKNIKNIFNSVPKCLKTFSDERQVLVLENLRSKGYEPHNRLLPMNIDHIKMVLKNYAKFHSVGFAFKDQKPFEYGNLIKNYSCGYKLMVESSFRPMFQAKATNSRNTIADIDESLAKKIDTILQKDVAKILDEIFDKSVEESVITHGDCWNSNFLFKYENENKESPTNVAILDWQVSSYRSPLLDLAYFLFIVSSEEQVSKFNDFLDYYYEELSKNITELGSDPDKLFPRSKFLNHWKYFSTMGFIFVITFLEMVLCDRNDAPDLGCVKTEDELIKLAMKTTAKNNDMYLERVLSLTRYYFDLTEK